MPILSSLRFLGILLFVALLCPAAAHAQAPAGTRYIYLVRHGDYDFDGTVDATVGNGLNDLGREQAAFVATRIANLPVRFTTVVTSQFTRARETGDIIATKLGAVRQRDGALNECRPPGEGVAPSLVTPGAETQLKQAWDRYTKSATATTRNDLLVCHGNVIRWFVCRALGIDTKQWTRLDIGNGSITVIAIQPDGTPHLLLYNDTSHIPLGKQSWVDQTPDWALPAAASAK